MPIPLRPSLVRKFSSLLSKKPWAISAFFFIITSTCLFLFDKPLAIFFHENAYFFKPLAKPISTLIAPPAALALLPSLFFYFFYIKKLERVATCVLHMSIAVSLSNLCAGAIKHLASRYRPDMLFQNGLYGFQWGTFSQTSFPSGHACTAAAIFGTLACFFPKYSIQFMTSAFVLSLCRVASTSHYLSDVLFGLYIGVMISEYTYRIIRKQERFVLLQGK